MKPAKPEPPVRCRFYEHTDGAVKVEVDPELIGELLLPKEVVGELNCKLVKTMFRFHALKGTP